MPLKKQKGVSDKQAVIGHWPIGYHSVRLVMRDGTGGEFFSNSGIATNSTMKIGAYGPNEWSGVLTTLLHEAMEAAMFWEGVRLQPDNRVGILSHADYLFVMTHEQFHACISKVGSFCQHAVPAMATAFNEWHRKPKAVKKRKKLRKK